MPRHIYIFATVLISILAKDALGAEGDKEGIIKEALTAAAGGNCPAKIMSPMLRGTCEAQMPNMATQLSARGTITKIEYMGLQPTAVGPTEVYRVFDAKGSMMWMVSVGSDGKLVTLWSPGG